MINLFKVIINIINIKNNINNKVNNNRIIIIKFK